MNESQKMMRYDANKKSLLIAYLLWFFAGMFGVHRMYAGRIMSGIVFLMMTSVSFLLTFILIGYITMLVPTIWWFLDIILLPGIISRFNNDLARSLDY